MFLFLALTLCHLSQAATWYSVNGASITNLANWRANTDGTGASPASFAAGDIFVLQAGHTCTMLADMNMAGTLTVNGTLNPPAARIIGGTGTLNGTGTVQVTRTTATADFASQYTITNKTLTNLTVDYAVTTGGQTITSTTYGNLLLSNTSGTNSVGGNITINGALTTTAGGTVNMSTSTLNGTLATITNNGTINTSNTSATPIASGKTWGGTGTINYTATTGGQTVVSGTYNNLSLSNTSGTNTAGGNITVNGTLTTSAGGTLNMTNAFTLGGTLGTITNNGTVSTLVPTTTSVTPLASGKAWGGTGTVIYAATTGAQTIMAGTYNDLTIGSTSGINTASGAIVVTDMLTTTDNGRTDFTTVTVGGIDATGSEIRGGLTLTGNVTSNSSLSPAPFLVTAASFALGGTTRTFTVAPTTGLSTNDANFGNITGTGGFIKEGLGNLFLSGTTNTYTGGTTINNGTLATNIDNLGAVPGAATPGYIIFNGGILDINADVTINSNKGISLGALGGQIAVSANPSPTQQLVTYGGIMAGVGMLTKGRSGKLVLSGANTYSGGTNVARGTLNIQNAAALGNPSAGLGTTVVSGGTLQLQGGITFNSQPLTLNGTGFNGTTGALNNTSGNNTWPSTVTLGSASTIQSDANTLTLSNSNSITGTNQDLTLQGVGNGIISGTITTGSGSLTHAGTGTWTLGAANTYTGTTVINNSGTLRLSATNAISSSSAVNISSASGILDLNNFSDAIGSLTGTGTVRSSVAGNPVLTTGNDNTSTIFSGVIQNGSATSVSLTKVGTGTMTISGANTYTGLTTVTNGTLALGATNTLSTNSPMALNGGVLSTGGFANSTGTLSLTNNSTIALGGATANALTFSASNALSWTANRILTITNWTGTVNASGSSGTTGRVFVGNTASGLTTGQLRQIRFLISGVLYDAVQLSSGEVVPTNLPLPITLLYFKANKSENRARLSWATSAEIDSKYFVIEHSSNGYDWKALLNVPTQQGSGTKDYSAFDPLPHGGTNYYRLIEVDVYGKRTEYSIAYLHYDTGFDKTGCDIIYPNPAKEIISINIEGDSPQIDLHIIDETGLEVSTKLLQKGINQVSCDNLLPGVYLLKFRLPKELLVCKVVVF